MKTAGGCGVVPFPSAICLFCLCDAGVTRLYGLELLAERFLLRLVSCTKKSMLRGGSSGQGIISSYLLHVAINLALV